MVRLHTQFQLKLKGSIMVSERKVKGDIGAAKVISDLTEKGYIVYTPIVCEHSRFDMIAVKDNNLFRIQVKYSSTGNISNTQVWNDKHGSHKTKYSLDEFDYYAIYLSDLNKVIYPNIKFGGAKIATEISNSATPFYWWEDFLEFTNEAKKKTFRDFGISLTSSGKGKTRTEFRKVVWPTKEVLEVLLWEKPTYLVAKDFGVSDKAVEKWTKVYGIKKPPRGYWAKLNSKKAIQ